MGIKTHNYISWILTGIIGLILIGTAIIKLSGTSLASEMAQGLGISTQTLFVIGIIELVSIILFVIPKTGVLGTLLLVAFMGGAMVAHVINGESFLFPMVIQILIWIAAYMRFPELHQRIFNTTNVNMHTN